MSDKIIKDKDGNVVGRVESEKPTDGEKSTMSLGALLIGAPLLSIFLGFVAYIIFGFGLGILVAVFGEGHQPDSLLEITFGWSTIIGAVVAILTFAGAVVMTFNDPASRRTIANEIKWIFIICLGIAGLVLLGKLLGNFTKISP